MAGAPNAYSDPYYQELAASTEQKLGLPVGLLSSIVMKGERSNADQVSSAGAKSVFQIVPATRDAGLKKYGIDAYLSPENAAEVAGNLLKDSLARNKGSVADAVSEYHGGTNRDNWGPLTKAYTGRVLAGQVRAKIDTLSQDFAKFMSANPTGSIAPKVDDVTPPTEDKLSQGFGAFLAQKNAPAPRSGADLIPRDDGTLAPTVQQLHANYLASGGQVPTDPTLVDKIIGGGETALTLATGATTGLVGMALGGAAGAIGNLTNGAYGNPAGVEAGMAQGAQAATYTPKTESGQQYAEAAGHALEQVAPAFPLTAELSALGKGAGAAAAGVRTAIGASGLEQAAANGIQRIRQAAPSIAERVERTLRRNPDPSPTPTPGTRGNGGSAGTDLADIRRQNAESLPVPIALTEGQATRDPSQLRFELETAKTPEGRKFQDRYAEQNENMYKNFDALVDATDTSQITKRGIGQSVDEAVRAKAQRDKTEIRVAYKNAEKAGELESPVTLDSVVQHLNESAPEATTAPLLTTARQAAIKLGVAVEDASGNLVPLETTLKNAEQFRKTINRATNFEPTNIRQAAIIKGAVDAQTDSIGGGLYRSARRLRENYANQYENRAVVNDLLNSKKGTSDRKIAFEDVLDHSMLNATLDDVRHVRRVLQTGGESGKQAYKDLQGGVASWIKDQAAANSATDMRGNVILSVPKLEKAIKQLDADGRLDFIFGKKGAQTYRDILDISRQVYTAPPGTVNTSNTAGVLLAALTEAGINGGIIGIPVPVLTSIKMATKHIKARKLQNRIDQSLARRPAPANPPQNL